MIKTVMTLETIKQAIDEGKKVELYKGSHEVVKHKFGHYMIHCKANGVVVGLHGMAGTTYENVANFPLKDFYIVEPTPEPISTASETELITVTATITIKARTQGDIDHIVEDIEFRHDLGGQEVEIIYPDSKEAESVSSLKALKDSPLLEACIYAFNNLSPKGDITKDFSGHNAKATLSKAIHNAKQQGICPDCGQHRASCDDVQSTDDGRWCDYKCFICGCTFRDVYVEQYTKTIEIDEIGQDMHK